MPRLSQGQSPPISAPRPVTTAGCPQAATGQCRGCHTEHLGRDADINKLNQAGFTHDLTNFPLKDAHVAVACTGCHKPETPYRKTPSTCIDCHRKDDIHRGDLGSRMHEVP